MIDPIAAYAAFSAVPLASLDAVPHLSGLTVSAADQSQFQAALHAPPEALVLTTPAVAIATVPLERLAAPGDLILRGLERLRGHYREVSAKADAVALESAVSPQELIGLQMQVAQVTLGTQLIGQVASKLEQNMNTLLKSS